MNHEIQGQKNSKRRSFKSVGIQIINYPGGKKVGSVPVQLPKEQLVRTIDTLKLPKRTDSIWLISRLTLAHSLHPTSADPHCQTVLSWTAFNAKLNKENSPLPSNVGYCQAIDANATDMSTIYTALCKSIHMGEQLGQEDIVIVFDLAIYAKAAEIIWKRQEEMSKVVIRMGAFHITCTLLAIIGKRFGDASFADLMIESGIIGMGYVNGVLDG